MQVTQTNNVASFNIPPIGAFGWYFQIGCTLLNWNPITHHWSGGNTLQYPSVPEPLRIARVLPRGHFMYAPMLRLQAESYVYAQSVRYPGALLPETPPTKLFLTPIKHPSKLIPRVTTPHNTRTQYLVSIFATRDKADWKARCQQWMASLSWD